MIFLLITGSGSLAAMAVFEDNFKPDMEVFLPPAQTLAIMSLSCCIFSYRNRRETICGGVHFYLQPYLCVLPTILHLF